MIIFKKANDLAKYLKALKKEGNQIGFVPTMGALHEGHLSLIQLSREQFDISVVSIFVNPTQFNDKEDFQKYPVTTESDIQLLELNEADILFFPNIDEIYPTDYQSIKYDLGDLENMLEGAYRPGHFQGICQVLDRLLRIIEPDSIIMGQKDYQQIKVVQKMIELTDKSIPLIIGPTLREHSGLAKSSRNARLTSVEKNQAKVLYQALKGIRDQLKEGADLKDLTRQAADLVLEHGFHKYDYFSICRREDLKAINEFQSGIPLIILAAAYIGNVRLIDNILVS